MFPRQRDRPRNGSFRSPLAYSNRTEATKEIKTHGYDAVFLFDLDQKHCCPICLAAINDPVQTKCGHRFCRNCLRRVCAGRRYLKCPADNTWLDPQIDLFEDNAMKREILSLAVKCREAECSWKGELRKLQSHEGNCQYVTVDCHHQCGMKIKRSALSDHTTSCPQRLEKCHHCNKKIVLSNMSKHQLLECMKFPVNCAVCGQTEIIREDIPKHIDVQTGQCPFVVVPCPLTTLGCTFQEKRMNILSHHTEASHRHMQLVVTKLTDQDKVIKQQEEKLGSHEKALTNATEMIEKLVNECTELKRLLAVHIATGCLSGAENSTNNGTSV